LAYLSKFTIPELLSCDGRLLYSTAIHDCECANVLQVSIPTKILVSQRVPKKSAVWHA